MAEMSQVSGSPETSSQANAPKDNRPLYEIGFHVVPTIEETKVGEVVETLRAEVKKAGGEIVGEQAPQKMVLSYVIERATSGKREKYSEAYFGWIKFVVEDRAGIVGLESYLQQNKTILRFLFIKTEREEAQVPRRAVFSSNRLEGETLKKPTAAPESPVGEISEEELNKSIDALVNQ
ncbi:MAG: Uncharacterized protein G01um101456_376 [Parcubacteria group bacterium Gr01-1014_56]|nr:MAG: Uncharacterized protein G01um101456_376 [Parcubacteria group bacterium Gr01-1014_56]